MFLELRPGAADTAQRILIDAAGKFLSWNNLSQPISSTMPTSKLLIFLVILVLDQEVGGSNPLAPTNLSNHLRAFLVASLLARNQAFCCARVGSNTRVAGTEPFVASLRISEVSDTFIS